MLIERWGPYCPIPQDHSLYVHVVYPVAHGTILDNGVFREMTTQELEAMNERFEGSEHFLVSRA